MGQYSIVIADDDRDLTQALTARCQNLGLRVCSAHTAIGALNLIHEVKPNLICLDVNMPSGSGLTVCEMIAADPQLARIPVIIMTGDASRRTRFDAATISAPFTSKNAPMSGRALSR